MAINTVLLKPRKTKIIYVSFFWHRKRYLVGELMQIIKFVFILQYMGIKNTQN